MPAGTEFQISEIVPDKLDPNNPAKKWGHIFGGPHDGKYTALEYPGNPIPISSYDFISSDPPVPGLHPDFMIAPIDQVTGLVLLAKRYTPKE